MRVLVLLALFLTSTASVAVGVVDGLLPSSSSSRQSSSRRPPSNVPKWAFTIRRTKKDAASMDLDVFQLLEELMQIRSLQNRKVPTTIFRSKEKTMERREDFSINKELPLPAKESRTIISNAARLADKIRMVLVLGILKLIVLLHLEVFVILHLPDRILVQFAKLCLARDARPQVLRLVATELDQRVQNYKFGDITKSIVCRYTGQPTYEFGDITRTILREAEKRRPQASERIQKQLDIFQELYQQLMK
jgi:hypothetical protein